MELEGFTASLQGKIVAMIVEKEEDCWLPYEFLPEGFTVLLCGKEPRSHRMLRDSTPWSVIWSPTTSREWSMLATIIKAAAAAGGHVLLVVDLDAPLPPIPFLEFLETLSSVTLIQLVRTGTPIGHPSAILWANSCSVASRVNVLRTLGCVEHGDSMTAAVAAVIESNVCIIAAKEDGRWKLYWIRPADSWALVKRLDESAKCSLRTGMALLDL